MITPHWDSYLNEFPIDKTDIYFTEEYHKLYASPEEAPLAFVYEENGNVLVFPFLSKESPIFDGTIVKDFETAYGYGGPISNSANQLFIRKALKGFIEELQSANYLAGFVRFHPLLHNSECFDSVGQLIYDRKTVAINLSGTENEVWMNEMHTKNRNVIKKGAKEGLVFEADYAYQSLERFIQLYNSTMDKLHADDFYYFGEEYFEKFPKLFPNSFIGKVSYNDQIIAAAIFFFDGVFGHYHLAGSDTNYLRLSPNNFLLWNAAMELKKHGVQLLHLGGGTDSDENNSLFQFKRKFSKNTYDFNIGKVVFNDSRYNEIVERWASTFPEKDARYKSRLLKYRY